MCIYKSRATSNMAPTTTGEGTSPKRCIACQKFSKVNVQVEFFYKVTIESTFENLYPERIVPLITCVRLMARTCLGFRCLGFSSGYSAIDNVRAVDGTHLFRVLGFGFRIEGLGTRDFDGPYLDRTKIARVCVLDCEGI